MGNEEEAAGDVNVIRERVRGNRQRLDELERWRSRHVNGSLGRMENQIANLIEDVQEIRADLKKLVERAPIELNNDPDGGLVRVLLALLSLAVTALIFVIGLYVQAHL